METINSIINSEYVVTYIAILLGLATLIVVMTIALGFNSTKEEDDIHIDEQEEEINTVDDYLNRVN